MGKHNTAPIITRIVPIGPDGQAEQSSPTAPEASQLTLLSVNSTAAPLGPAQARLAQQASEASQTQSKATGKTTAKAAKTTTKTSAAKRSSRTATKVIPMETIAPESHDGYPDVSRLQNLEEAIARLNSQSQHVRHTLEELQKLSEALPKPPRALEMPNFSRSRLATWEAEPIDPQLTLQEAQQRHQAEIPLARRSVDRPSSPQLPPPPLARPSQTAPQRPTQRQAPRASRRRPVKRGWRSIAQGFVQLWNQRLPIPQKSGAKAIDGMLWLSGAIALRWLVGMAVGFVPALGWVLPIIMLVPGIYAAYLAFCQPDSRTDQVYRLSLLTLGFFLGSKI